MNELDNIEYSIFGGGFNLWWWCEGRKGETYGGWDGNKIAFSRPVLVSLLGKCNQFVCWLLLLLLLDNKDARFNLEAAGRKC